MIWRKAATWTGSLSLLFSIKPFDPYGYFKRRLIGEGYAAVLNRDVLVAFGSNQGDGEAVFEQIVQRFQSESNIFDLVRSDLVSTPAIGGPLGQSDYLNACLRFRSNLPAPQLLNLLLQIEKDLGRQRSVRWAGRNVDLDLLLHGDSVFAGIADQLTLPHPRMTFRRFVLKPAVQIAGDMVHPLSGVCLNDLLHHLDNAENRIGLVTTTKPPCLKLLESARQICRSRGSDVVHFAGAVFPDCAVSALKLAVAFESDENHLVEQVRRLPMPTLIVANFALPTLEMELAAAIEAMKTWE